MPFGWTLARIATFGDGRDVPPRSGEAGRDTEAERRRETVGDTDRYRPDAPTEHGAGIGQALRRDVLGHE